MTPNVADYFWLQVDKKTCHLTEHLSQFFNCEQWCDLVFICAQNHVLRAHRCVLAAASQYFHFLFRDTQDDVVYISVENYDSNLFQKMLELVYTGATTISSSEETSLSNLLSDFEIGGSAAAVSIVATGNLEAVEEEVQIVQADPPFEFREPAPVASSKKKLYECNICGQALATKTGHRMHMDGHLDSKCFMCEVCGKGFKQCSQLKTHSRTHTKEKPFKCSFCPKLFSHKSTVQEHENIHKNSKPFECSVCHQSFAQKKRLREHRCEENLADGPVVQSFQCPFCNRSFPTRRGLSVHQMHQHGEEMQTSVAILECELCHLTFSCESTYDEHLASHY